MSNGRQLNEVMRIVEPWLDEDSDGRLSELMRQVQWLGRELYGDYEPSNYDSFDERFGKWLGNVSIDDDKKTLFMLLEHLFFVGRREFEALCRAAFTGPVTRWLIDMDAIAIDSSDAAQRLKEAVKRTWFCPVTDSMRINAFLKLNHIEGKQYRPDWRSLRRFGDPAKMKRYMEDSKLERLVLLEDFVGSGNQMSEPAVFAAEHFPHTEILLCPLVICPRGVEAGIALAATYKNLHFAPVLRVPEHALLHEEKQLGEPIIFDRVRKVAKTTTNRLARANQGTPFGFKKVGALVVMYSNCPNNTLPIVHNESEDWQALFPRIRRN